MPILAFSTEGSVGDTAVIVTAICGVITAVGVPLIAYLMARLNAQQAAAAAEVRGVKDTLVKSTTNTTKQLADLDSKVNLFNEVAKIMAELDGKIEVIHKATNSIKDELVQATDKMARAEGREAGRVEEIEAESLRRKTERDASQAPTINRPPAPLTPPPHGRDRPGKPGETK